MKEAFGWIGQLRDNVRRAYLGPAEGLELSLGCLLAGGHLLLDDVPGVGKTTLARAIARSLDLGYKRVQFTSDLLPGDVTGSFVYDPSKADFNFRRGPIFTNVLLADEINRASPRTQSSLLECMGEGGVTIDGQHFPLPDPFWVMATQNPIETQGTFLLPRSQLDRFMVRTSLGYPDEASELAILESSLSGNGQDVGAVLKPEQIVQIRSLVGRLEVKAEVRQYVVRVVRATRETPRLSLGGGPRASIALLRMAGAWALLDQRAYVTVDDVKAVAYPVLAHRLVEADGEISPARRSTVNEILETVPSPL